MKKLMLILPLSVLAFASASMAREINCEAPKGAPTVNSIRNLILTVSDQGGPATAEISRDGKMSVIRRASFSVTGGGPFSFGEDSELPRGDAYSVSESVTLRKTRGEDGSAFALVKSRTTLSGPHCDGYHMCTLDEVVVESAPIACTDTLDLIPPSTGYHCDPDLPGDCE